MTCVRAQEFLERKDLTANDTVDARKQAIGRKEALELASSVDEIYAAKGTKVVHVDMRKQSPGKDELAALLLGPTGNLRAPTLRRGRKLMVGFNEDAYRRFFG
jgi:arsenate reductase-like glutaredoxin family protein